MYNVVCDRTSVANNQPVQEQAISGEDFISRQAMVIVQENVTRVPVEIVIKHVCIAQNLACIQGSR